MCITDAFFAAHPTLADIVVAKADQPGSNWKLISRDVLLARAARPHLKNVLVALVTAEEQLSDEFAGVKLKLTSTCALLWITTIVEESCCLNLCGA